MKGFREIVLSFTLALLTGLSLFKLRQMLKTSSRPSNPAVVPAESLQKLPKLELISIDDPIFGGWKKAQPYHFGDGGIFDQIYKPASSN